MKRYAIHPTKNFIIDRSMTTVTDGRNFATTCSWKQVNVRCNCQKEVFQTQPRTQNHLSYRGRLPYELTCRASTNWLAWLPVKMMGPSAGTLLRPITSTLWKRGKRKYCEVTSILVSEKTRETRKLPGPYHGAHSWFSPSPCTRAIASASS